ncbi:MAG TPA: DUF6504 family protein [Candidatus Methylacidiphilales bacterium]|nr:DUF6504 family protein [Candidatus Methylacidiphilales bacterium]
MSVSFVSEPITPVEAGFDLSGMARGEPGLPHQFRWRKKAYTVTHVLEQGKEHGDCSNGSGERYVRRHVYLVRTAEGALFRLYFQRSFGRSRYLKKRRWWVLSVETEE